MQVGRAFFVVLDQKCGRCHATHGRLTRKPIRPWDYSRALGAIEQSSSIAIWGMGRGGPLPNFLDLGSNTFCTTLPGPNTVLNW